MLWYAALGLAAPIYYISVFHIHGKRVYIHENLPSCTTNTIGIGMDRRPASPLLNCKCSKRSLALNIYYIFCKILNQSLACLKCLLLLLHTLISLSISLSFFLKIYQDGYTNKKYLCRPRPKAQILKIYQIYRRVVQHKVKDIQYISYMPFTYFSNIYIIHFVNTDLIERSKEHRISSQFFLILVIKNMMLVYVEGNFCIFYSRFYTD